MLSLNNPRPYSKMVFAFIAYLNVTLYNITKVFWSVS